jgi:hypothetical protein
VRCHERMIGLVASTQSETDKINADAEHTRAVVQKSSANFERLVRDFSVMNGQLREISAAMRNLERANAHIHDQVSQIQALSGNVTAADEGLRNLLARFVVPTHIKAASQPLTGDPAMDLLRRRDKRIFDKPTEQRAASSTASSLMQTYLRDTGGVLLDLAMPIPVGGRHWGALRVASARSR